MEPRKSLKIKKKIRKFKKQLKEPPKTSLTKKKIIPSPKAYLPRKLLKTLSLKSLSYSQKTDS